MQLFRNMDQEPNIDITRHPDYPSLTEEQRRVVTETYNTSFLNNQGRLGIKIAQGIAYETAKKLMEDHVGFKNMVDKLEGEGKSADSAGAIAASIGNKKYGKAAMHNAAKNHHSLGEAQEGDNDGGAGAILKKNHEEKYCKECGNKMADCTCDDNDKDVDEAETEEPGATYEAERAHVAKLKENEAGQNAADMWNRAVELHDAGLHEATLAILKKNNKLDEVTTITESDEPHTSHPLHSTLEKHGYKHTGTSDWGTLGNVHNYSHYSHPSGHSAQIGHAGKDNQEMHQDWWHGKGDVVNSPHTTHTTGKGTGKDSLDKHLSDIRDLHKVNEALKPSDYSGKNRKIAAKKVGRNEGKKQAQMKEDESDGAAAIQKLNVGLKRCSACGDKHPMDEPCPTVVAPGLPPFGDPGEGAGEILKKNHTSKGMVGESYSPAIKAAIAEARNLQEEVPTYHSVLSKHGYDHRTSEPNGDGSYTSRHEHPNGSHVELHNRTHGNPNSGGWTHKGKNKSLVGNKGDSPQDLNRHLNKVKSQTKARANSKGRDDVMRSLGLNKVKGSQSGKTYWEELEYEGTALQEGMQTFQKGSPEWQKYAENHKLLGAYGRAVDAIKHATVMGGHGGHVVKFKNGENVTYAVVAPKDQTQAHKHTPFHDTLEKNGYHHTKSDTEGMGNLNQVTHEYEHPTKDKIKISHMGDGYHWTTDKGYKGPYGYNHKTLKAHLEGKKAAPKGEELGEAYLTEVSQAIPWPARSKHAGKYTKPKGDEGSTYTHPDGHKLTHNKENNTWTHTSAEGKVKKDMKPGDMHVHLMKTHGNFDQKVKDHLDTLHKGGFSADSHMSHAMGALSYQHHKKGAGDHEDNAVNYKAMHSALMKASKGQRGVR